MSVALRWLAGSVLASSALGAALPRASQPYLAAITPLSLRFAPPPPDISTCPVPAAPPAPDGILGEVAHLNQAAIVPEGTASTDVETPVSPEESVFAEAETATAPSPQQPSFNRTPVEILPDDLRREVRTEDLLPYFLPPQIPAGPPSQATYRQQ